MKENKPIRSTDSTEQMQTLSQCMNHALKDGYRENFKVSGSRLTTENGSASFNPDQIAIKNFYRFEGYSDPGDNSILYLIETDNGLKGMLLDAYDAYADAAISQFIAKVDAINKRPHEERSFLRTLRRFFGFKK